MNSLDVVACPLSNYRPYPDTDNPEPNGWSYLQEPPAAEVGAAPFVLSGRRYRRATWVLCPEAWNAAIGIPQRIPVQQHSDTFSVSATTDGLGVTIPAAVLRHRLPRALALCRTSDARLGLKLLVEQAEKAEASGDRLVLLIST
jgi:hypothetical protein